MKLNLTLVAFERGSGSGFEAGNHRGKGRSRDVHGELHEHCGSQPDVNRACVGVSGNELSCPSMERLVRCDSEQASYSAPSRSSQQLACCLHLFLCHVSRDKQQQAG